VPSSVNSLVCFCRLFVYGPKFNKVYFCLAGLILNKDYTFNLVLQHDTCLKESDKKKAVCRGEMDDDGAEITLMSCGKINTTSSWPYSPCRLQSHWGYLTP
jgi:hypothetical protein